MKAGEGLSFEVAGEAEVIKQKIKDSIHIFKQYDVQFDIHPTNISVNTRSIIHFGGNPFETGQGVT